GPEGGWRAKVEGGKRRLSDPAEQGAEALARCDGLDLLLSARRLGEEPSLRVCLEVHQGLAEDLRRGSRSKRQILSRLCGQQSRSRARLTPSVAMPRGTEDRSNAAGEGVTLSRLLFRGSGRRR